MVPRWIATRPGYSRASSDEVLKEGNLDLRNQGQENLVGPPRLSMGLLHRDDRISWTPRTGPPSKLSIPLARRRCDAGNEAEGPCGGVQVPGRSGVLRRGPPRLTRGNDQKGGSPRGGSWPDDIVRFGVIDEWAHRGKGLSGLVGSAPPPLGVCLLFGLLECPRFGPSIHPIQRALRLRAPALR